MTVSLIDCHYAGYERVAAAYLIVEGGQAAFVETNTTHSVPRLLAALAEHGLTTDDVQYVIITHVHLDHAGGASALMAACANAQLLCHPRAAPHVIDPSKLVGSARKVYGDAVFDHLYGEINGVPADRVRALEDGHELIWGDRTLTFHYTRGHANHHFVIYDSATDAVFTGDAFGVAYPALQPGGRLIFPSSSPTDFDAAAAIGSVQRIVATGARRAWLTHFGAVDELDSAASELVDRLTDYGRWVDEADRDDVPDESLDAYMSERVTADFDACLAARGLGPDARQLIRLDADINAQGLAFAVRKRRFKRRSSPRT
ncbi:MAG: glyoxylase-like metal-dependent hydrolase (beta-lactamase superfamily II) [Kiritimatiellia bacterium]|jgi:glyoxylase-like metal-dependent hydrolase (beta-lactamase superfamily II)